MARGDENAHIRRQFGKALLNDLPDGFKIFESGQFVIAYQTEKSYARWVGGLYTRLYRGFNTYWTKKRKFKLKKPEYPLGVIIFASKAEYDRYVKSDIGIESGTMVAYYNLMTNRVAMYDLTASQLPGGANDRRITEVLNLTEIKPTFAVTTETIQIKFTCQPCRIIFKIDSYY